MAAVCSRPQHCQLCFSWHRCSAGDGIFVQATSSKSFDATVGALKRAAGSNGMMIMGHVDQASALSMTGLHLAGAESFLVGNPTVGKEFYMGARSAVPQLLDGHSPIAAVRPGYPCCRVRNL